MLHGIVQEIQRVVVIADRQGNRYIPSIVRVGLSVHHSVEAVSLDALVESRMRSAKASSCTLAGCLARNCQVSAEHHFTTYCPSLELPEPFLVLQYL